MNIVLRKLENGVPVILIPFPHAQSFIQLCMVGGGSRYERPHLSGISHFLEHMMFKGTKKRPNVNEIAEEIDSLGASTNAFTSKEFIGFYIQAMEENFEHVTDILADQIVSPVVPSDEIEKEKNTVIEEIRGAMSSPQQIALELLPYLIYGDQVEGRSVTGTEGTVRSLTRRQLCAYIKRYFVRDNFVIVVAGKIPEEKHTLRTLNRYYASIPDGSAPRKYKVRNTKQTEPRVTVCNWDIEQSYIALGLRSFPRFSESYPTLSVLNSLLGGSMSSRLFSEIREKRGLAYHISSYNFAGSDAGKLVVMGGMNKENVFEALRVIHGEMQKFCENPVSADELEKAKNSLIGGAKVALDRYENFAELVARSYTLSGRVLDPIEEFEKVRGVTTEDVQNIARQMFAGKNFNLVVVGPHTTKQEEKFRNILS